MAAFIDLKQINGRMSRRELNQLVQRIAPAFRSLVRQAGDQVEADVVNSCGVKNGQRAIDIRAAVHAAGGLEFDVGKRLHSEADAIDSSCGPVCGFFRLYSFGIGFQRYFTEFGRKRFANRVEHRLKMSRVKQARRSTPEINGVHGEFCERIRQRNASMREAGPVFADFGLHGGRIRSKTRARDHARMKIAVRAFGLAKRDLNVDAEARRLYKNCSTRGLALMRCKMDGVPQLRSGNNEMRAGAFDTRE